MRWKQLTKWLNSYQLRSVVKQFEQYGEEDQYEIREGGKKSGGELGKVALFIKKEG